jgi:N-acetylmuramidase
LVTVPGTAYTFGLVDMPRIAYAYDVVLNRRLPPTAPGDLLQTGQVGDAQSFIARPTPLVFEHDLTGTLPAALAAPPRLAEADYVAAALNLGVEVAAIMAVAQVEAGGRVGFAADGRPIIRYELHVFHQRTGGIYHATHPHLSQPTLHAGNPYHDNTQATEWSLMHGAMILRDGGNRRTSDAWQSASWGMFQVMGFNYSHVGWNSIDAFVADMFRSEGQHLNAFVGYVRNTHLAGDIVAHNWAHFARVYNGPSYAVNHYDVNMAAAYAQISARRQRQHLQP